MPRPAATEADLVNQLGAVGVLRESACEKSVAMQVAQQKWSLVRREHHPTAGCCTERDICNWAARTTAAGRSYVDVRDSIMFDTHSLSDVRLFLSPACSGLGLPVNVCLNGQDFLADNTDPDVA